MSSITDGHASKHPDGLPNRRRRSPLVPTLGPRLPAKAPVAGLGSFHSGRFNALFADGSVRFPEDLDLLASPSTLDAYHAECNDGLTV